MGQHGPAYTILLQENAGNDPLSQIVHGGQGGWQKPEPEQPPPVQTERPSSLVGNSNWASRQQQDQVQSVSQQPLVADSGYHSGYSARDRRLNPAEFPSLSAAAYAAEQQQSKQQLQAANAGQVQSPEQWHVLAQKLQLASLCMGCVGNRAVG